jgi:glycerol-3-phosphate dehydrogenase
LKNSTFQRYYYAGSKLYDLFAGSKGLTSSYYISKRKIFEEIPMLKKNILGGMVYYGKLMKNLPSRWTT